MTGRITILITFILLGDGVLSAQNFWQQTTGPNAGPVTAIVSHQDGSRFAGTAGGVFKTTDAGANWVAINNGLTNLNVLALTVTSTGTVIAGTQGGIFRLPNLATTWQQASLAGVSVQALGARSSAEIYAGLPGPGVFISTDDGIAWNPTALGNVTPSSFAFSGSSGQVFAGTSTGVFRSADAGAHWTQVNTGLTNTGITALAIEGNGILFAGANDAGVFRSTNNGDLWAQVNNGLAGTSILSLAANALNHIFAGTNIGAFRSTDEGTSWRRINAGLSDPIIRSLHAAPNGFLFAGGSSGLVCRSAESTDGIFIVLQPNGGEDWQIGTVQQIRWNSIRITGAVRIELTRDAGGSYSTIVDSTANTGVYPLTITGPATTQARIRLSSYVDRVLTDSSDALFSISTVPPASITVVSPNGGEVWQAGTTQSIQWTSANLPGKVMIELSRNGGQTFSVLVDSTNNTGTFPWLVSSPATVQGRVRITSVVNGAVFDISDNNFTISPPPSITVVVPNGGENWQVGTTQNIQWTSVNVTGKVKIEISRDSAQTFAVIADSTNNTGTFPWSVTGPATTRARVRISASSASGVGDVSDNNFTISPPPFVIVIHPNGGEVLQVGSTDSIRWTSGGVTGNARIEISRDGGATFAIIDTNVANSGTYVWRVSNPRTLFARVRIVFPRPGLPPTADTSDGDFAISALSVTAPDTVVTGTTPPVVVRPPGNFGTGVATLFLRNGGKTAYDSLAMTQVGADFQTVIPARYINIRGVEFYVLLFNGRTQITYPDSIPAARPAAIRVRVQTIMSPGVFQRHIYKMVSVPVVLTDPSLAGTFVDDYGPYNRSKWRVFKWEGSAYVEFPGITSNLTPGNAFWLITHAGAPFDVDSGLSVSTRQPNVITVSPGWNQIADPYAFRIDWNAVAGGALLSGPFLFDRGAYRVPPVRVLQPWEGYFVYNAGLQPVNISVPAVEADSILPPLSDWPPEISYGLRLSASASGTELADAENIVGFTANQAGARISPEPPIIGDEFIRLSVTEGSEKCLVSLKPMTNDGAFWDFNLATTLQNRFLQVHLSKQGELPSGFEVFVVDKDNEALIPIAANSFSIYVRTSVRSLRLILGTRKFAEDHSESIPLSPLQYRLDHNYPNPFNPETKIRYQLSKRSTVRLEIYNIVGQKIRTLVQGEQTTGTYEIFWDGTNDSGRLIGSGVYLYRIQAEASVSGPDDRFTVTHKMVLVR